MLIILLRGYSQSGKDFIGKILCDTYGFKRFAFADSLKKIISLNYTCAVDILHSQEGKLKICETDPLKRSYRQILIDEALRLKETDQDIFAKECCKDILKLYEDSYANKIVITDWRFPNELEVIKQYFPNYKIITVHVHRHNQILSPVDNISEYHLENHNSDYSIVNNMNEEIYDQIDRLFNYINK